MSATDFMRASPVESGGINYPLIQDTPTRIQIITSPETYGLLLLNERTGKWCGYTLLSQYDAMSIDSWKHIVGASFLAPASNPIVWMLPDRAGNLTQQATLLDQSAGGDFWVGFHTDLGVDDKLRAISHVSRFIVLVKKGLLSHANPTV